MPNIHPTAVVSPKAEIDTHVTVGPHSVVEDHVTIHSGTEIGPQCVIHPYVRLGADNQLHAQVVLGGLPQDLSFSGEESWLEIGDGNVFRENCSVHRSTRPDVPTRIGNRCYLMGYSHVAHDCQLGDEVVLTAYVGLSGHIEIGDKANLGGHVGTHQHIRIGTLSMVAGYTPVRKDVMPYCLLGGDPVRHYRLNSIGLRRAGIKGKRYRELEQAYRHLRQGESVESLQGSPEVDLLRDWMLAPSKRGIYGFLQSQD
ncbi:MAG: acyl-ACP--UDP-N-acetylglucosamine O-acyltransferase [Gammaproteobacteria bacterium]|nr:acyl-ACP--UDP-N-acetylglucosamine O-acyltransferase [Gammaproteobacteria bacterium]